jgi:hypothetical protein
MVSEVVTRQDWRPIFSMDRFSLDRDKYEFTRAVKDAKPCGFSR